MLENKKITEKDIIMSPRVYKPWEITDEMINKIPKIDYYGLTKEQSEELNIIVKKTLQEVRNDNIDREVAFVYDLNGFMNQDGEWLLKTTGETNTDKIILSKNSDIAHLLNYETKSVVIISHNHPKNRIISLLDLSTLCGEPNIHLIVAVTNAGNISYIVKDNFDRNKYLEISKEIIDSYNNVPVDNDVFLVDLLNNCEKFGVRFVRAV